MIREVTIHDAEQLLTVMKQIDSESPTMLFEANERQTTLDQQKMMIEKLTRDETSTIFVSLHDEQIVGYLMAIGNHARRKRHSCYVVIGIAAAYHGRGIGTALFQRLEEWAMSKGMTRIELSVLTDNEAAIALYKKVGFVVEGVKQQSLRIGDDYKDEYYMAKLYEPVDL